MPVIRQSQLSFEEIANDPFLEDGLDDDTEAANEAVKEMLTCDPAEIVREGTCTNPPTEKHGIIVRRGEGSHWSIDCNVCGGHFDEWNSTEPTKCMLCGEKNEYQEEPITAEDLALCARAVIEAANDDTADWKAVREEIDIMEDILDRYELGGEGG